MTTHIYAVWRRIDNRGTKFVEIQFDVNWPCVGALLLLLF